MIERSKYWATWASDIPFNMDPGKLETALEKAFEHPPTDGQREAMKHLSRFVAEREGQDVFILKGYAGTGKTSLVSALVRVLPGFRTGTVLLAPTGRAAKVISSYSGKAAATVHRRIYRVFTSEDGQLRMSLQQNMYRNTLFLVDEASMISDGGNGEQGMFSGSRLLEDMITYVRSGESCNLVLIGDTAQLPPVGMEESPALDTAYLQASYQVKIWQEELTEVVRQARYSGILSNATDIREMITKGKSSPPFFRLDSFQDVVSINGIDLEDALQQAFSSGEREDTLLICRSNKRANIFNKEVRQRILFYEADLNAGDLIMVVRNNYFWLPEESPAGFLANGDILEVLRVRKTQELYGFRFADVQIRMIDYPEEKDMEVRVLLDSLWVNGPAMPWTEMKRLYDELMKDFSDLPSMAARRKSVRNHPCYQALQIKFSYALTGHKSQGGQWKYVFIEQGYLTENMLDKSFMRWLYTAVTRATVKLFLVNFSDKFFASR